MNLENLTVGFAMTGSFCTYKRVFPQIEKIKAEGARVIPIMSEISSAADTRFGTAAENILRLKAITGENVIKTISEAEPIGPKKMLDVLIVAPCTGNTIAKIAGGIADSTVTLAVKSHLRNRRPVVIAVSTNDGLGGNAKNIGILASRKNIYIVPFGQDDCIEKENSLVSDMNMIIPTAELALDGRQIQPILITY
mgnify:FL=1